MRQSSCEGQSRRQLFVHPRTPLQAEGHCAEKLSCMWMSWQARSMTPGFIQATTFLSKRKVGPERPPRSCTISLGFTCICGCGHEIVQQKKNHTPHLHQQGLKLSVRSIVGKPTKIELGSTCRPDSYDKANQQTVLKKDQCRQSKCQSCGWGCPPSRHEQGESKIKTEREDDTLIDMMYVDMSPTRKSPISVPCVYTTVSVRSMILLAGCLSKHS